MIVRILSNGKSFQGCAAYLTHDADQAKTADRVGWTHTHNCANESVPGAVNEMVWTARDAELLKQEAGVRAGGRATEKSVKHFSLNWSPEDRPSREHMIQTTEDFLRHMKWQDHQAIFVSHTDKPYAHVHCMLNVVHPETGLRLDDNYERRRAQAWALEYERTQGRIYCQQRLKDPAERENAPPRNIWMAFHENEREFAQAEKSLAENTPIIVDEPVNRRNSEWKILKEIQRTERTDFFAAGKSEFKELRNSIYREIRAEFRGRWSDYYEVSRGGGDPDELAALKAGIIADQKAVLDSRRDEACCELREYRAGLYRGLLDDQRDVRLDLRARQEAGLENSDFIASLKHENPAEDIRTSFRDAAEETTGRDGDGSEAGFSADASGEANSPAGSGSSGSLELGLGFTAFDSLLSVFEGPPRNPPRPSAASQLKAAADDAVKRREGEREEEADAAWRRARQRSFHGD